MQYKSFLSGEKILSFTDLDGRLLALRPDVTLSIIKNAHENETAKAYYIEKVYRESKESNTFKEINQMGLEFMGPVDAYALAETVLLAQQSLQICAESLDNSEKRDYILEIGHMGFVMGLLEKLELLPNEREEVIDCYRAQCRRFCSVRKAFAAVKKCKKPCRNCRKFIRLWMLKPGSMCGWISVC